MYWSDVGYLCREICTFDKFNRPQKAGFEKREVLCNKTGVKRSEFYQAQAAGKKPELCVEIMACEYEGEVYFEYDDVMYKVLRSYPAKRESIELVCEGLAVGNG